VRLEEGSSKRNDSVGKQSIGGIALSISMLRDAALEKGKVQEITPQGKGAVPASRVEGEKKQKGPAAWNPGGKGSGVKTAAEGGGEEIVHRTEREKKPT